ncbi:hypothetical protein CR513_40143, partial [Mucuna pruriens]
MYLKVIFCNKMNSTRKCSVTLAFLLAFFIIASDMCMEAEARGPIVHIHCSRDIDCDYRPCANICGCRCIDTYCVCMRPPLTHSIIFCNKMDTKRKSSVTLAFLLAFFIIASDMCMEAEARGPIVHIHCSTNDECSYRPCIKCGCKCFNTYCYCPAPSFPDNIHTRAPPN